MDAPIPENINRVVIDGEVASSVDEAIQVLRYACLSNFLTGMLL